MNLDVAILSGISFNRLHFMVMRPVPCRSMCTYPLSFTHAWPRTQTHNPKQTHSRPLSSRLYLSLSLPHCLLLCLSLVASSQYYATVFGFRSPPVSPLMRFGSSLSDASVCLDIKESDGLMLTVP